MHDAEHHQGGAPADQLAEQAARSLAEHDAQDLPGDVARQHGLAPLVGDDVADPGDGHGDDGGGAGTGQEARHHERAERRHARGDHAGDAGPQRAEHDHQDLAARIPQRPHRHLEHAVGERERRHHHRRRRRSWCRARRRFAAAAGRTRAGWRRWRRRRAPAARWRASASRRPRRSPVLRLPQPSALATWQGGDLSRPQDARHGSHAPSGIACRDDRCGRDRLLADAALAVAAVAGEVEMEVVAVVDVVGRAQHGREHAARAAMHVAQEVALGQAPHQPDLTATSRPSARTNAEMSTALAWPCSDRRAPSTWFMGRQE